MHTSTAYSTRSPRRCPAYPSREIELTRPYRSTAPRGLAMTRPPQSQSNDAVPRCLLATTYARAQGRTAHGAIFRHSGIRSNRVCKHHGDTTRIRTERLSCTLAPRVRPQDDSSVSRVTILCTTTNVYTSCAERTASLPPTTYCTLRLVVRPAAPANQQDLRPDRSKSTSRDSRCTIVVGGSHP